MYGRCRWRHVEIRNGTFIRSSIILLVGNKGERGTHKKHISRFWQAGRVDFGYNTSRSDRYNFSDSEIRICIFHYYYYYFYTSPPLVQLPSRLVCFRDFSCGKSFPFQRVLFILSIFSSGKWARSNF